MTQDELNEVLRLVNDARRAIGQPQLERLPKGVRRDSCECPIARAFRIGDEYSAASRLTLVLADYNDEWANAIAKIWNTERPRKGAVGLPKLITDFTGAFDAGEFPEFEEAA
jgi:hypothetical protein